MPTTTSPSLNTLPRAGEQARINHFPYRLDPRYDMKFEQHRPVDEGASRGVVGFELSLGDSSRL